MANRRFRIERDALGSKRVPADAYYGVQTQRAVENFPISGSRVPWEMIQAIVTVKWAAAQANMALGQLNRRAGRAIVRAAQQVLRERWTDQFVVDAFQAGAGTSLHMNANEVLANRANELVGGRRGAYQPIHPNDHVNMAQSTNDVIPTSLRLASLGLLPGLDAAMARLEAGLRRKARQFWPVMKSARTHLKDAVPIRLGQEFSGYADVVREARQRIREAGRYLHELNLGATAAGTGLNAHPRYRAIAIRGLRRLTGLPVKPAKNLFEITQSLADFGHLSGALRSYAVELGKMANDLRLLDSGPMTGLAEIQLPAVQPGSSIMPGKVNPVMCEMTSMVCYHVIGLDAAITQACAAGQLDLNVMMPLVAHELLQELKLLTSATTVLTARCIEGIRAEVVRCRWYADRSVSIATVLSPIIGYAKTAEIVKEAVRTHKSIPQLVIEKGYLAPAQAKRLLDPRRMA